MHNKMKRICNSYKKHSFKSKQESIIGCMLEKSKQRYKENLLKNRVELKCDLCGVCSKNTKKIDNYTKDLVLMFNNLNHQSKICTDDLIIILRPSGFDSNSSSSSSYLKPQCKIKNRKDFNRFIHFREFNLNYKQCGSCNTEIFEKNEETVCLDCILKHRLGSQCLNCRKCFCKSDLCKRKEFICEECTSNKNVIDCSKCSIMIKKDKDTFKITNSNLVCKKKNSCFCGDIKNLCDAHLNEIRPNFKEMKCSKCDYMFCFYEEESHVKKSSYEKSCIPIRIGPKLFCKDCSKNIQ